MTDHITNRDLAELIRAEGDFTRTTMLNLTTPKYADMEALNEARERLDCVRHRLSGND